MCTQAFRTFAKDLKYRLQEVASAYAMMGTLEFLRGGLGPYDVTFTDCQATLITHDSGDFAVIDASETFSTAFTFHDEHSDAEAHVVGPRTKRPWHLQDFFEEGTGPHIGIDLVWPTVRSKPSRTFCV